LGDFLPFALNWDMCHLHLILRFVAFELNFAMVPFAFNMGICAISTNLGDLCHLHLIWGLCHLPKKLEFFRFALNLGFVRSALNLELVPFALTTNGICAFCTYNKLDLCH
jgi:hypothetical protein